MTPEPNVNRNGVRNASATLTGLEPATSAVTGRRANQLRHRALLYCIFREFHWLWPSVLLGLKLSRRTRYFPNPYPLRDSNPRYRLERAAS